LITDPLGGDSTVTVTTCAATVLVVVTELPPQPAKAAATAIADTPAAHIRMPKILW